MRKVAVIPRAATGHRFRHVLHPLFALGLAMGCANALFAQAPDRTLRGKVERIKVHGQSLEGNLSKDSPERDVSVYLPPSYATDAARRYPVVYMLHGYTDDDARWFGMVRHWVDFPVVIEQALTGPETREMIFVMPNSYTRFQGSMYSNSVVTGNWEDFVARDLVAYIDAHYRTIPEVASRGLAGHSMGGYGAMRIGMKYPDIFSSIYLLSPCCLPPRTGSSGSAAAYATVEAIKNMDDFARASFGTRFIIASAAAWAPNPKNPPFFVDLPSKNGELQPLVLAKFSANAPLAMVDQYIANLKRLRAIAFDAGDQDRSIAASIRDLDQILADYSTPHIFEIYEGDHVNRVAERIRTKVLPFFSKNLSFPAVRD
jgi:enterochelin esterase-like enzyme